LSAIWRVRHVLVKTHERLTFYCGGHELVCDQLGARRVDFLLEQARKGEGPLLVEEYEGGPRWVFPVGATAVKYETVEGLDDTQADQVMRAAAGLGPQR
jgi:hypothetical protein